MRPLNKAWIASGVGNLHKLVFDEVKQRWVMPCHTAAAKRPRKCTRDTPLAKLKGFHKGAIAKCAKEIDGKRITTVGQLAALDLDISKEENKIYLRKLTKCRDFAAAVKMAAKWKAKAIEALAFWQ